MSWACLEDIPGRISFTTDLWTSVTGTEARLTALFRRSLGKLCLPSFFSQEFPYKIWSSRVHALTYHMQVMLEFYDPYVLCYNSPKFQYDI